jgi:hypothetical protein
MTDRGFISENYSGSGFIDNSKLALLSSTLKDGRNEALVGKVFNESGLKAIGHAIDYAMANKAGLVEASDIVVPFTNGSCSDLDNFRADFMKTDGDHNNSRSPGDPGTSGGLWSAVRGAFKK